MKMHFTRLTAVLATACIASLISCYPAYPQANYNSAYTQDSKGGYAPQQPVPQQPVPQPQAPHYVGVDPGLVVAGVAAAGILGYAIGHNNGYYHGPYYGRGYYRPVYYGRGCYPPPYYR